MLYNRYYLVKKCAARYGSKAKLLIVFSKQTIINTDEQGITALRAEHGVFKEEINQKLDGMQERMRTGFDAIMHALAAQRR